MRFAPRLPSATVALACLFLIGAVSGCGGDEDSASSDDGAKTVRLESAEGGEAGTVKFTPMGEKVEVEAEVNGLTPGFHGFHIHETGTCEPDAPMGAFDTAGGHFASGSQSHGDHAGDMPPLLAGQDGTARATITTERFTLDDLADDDGSAVMLHADPDNQANVPDRYRAGKQPGADDDTLDTGDSGDRVACGAVSKSS
jgi:Cu-Zn family superoxide dismutase